MRKVRCNNKPLQNVKLSCANVLFFIDDESLIIELYCKDCKSYHYFKVSSIEKVELTDDEIRTFQQKKKFAHNYKPAASALDNNEKGRRRLKEFATI